MEPKLESHFLCSCGTGTKTTEHSIQSCLSLTVSDVYLCLEKFTFATKKKKEGKRQHPSDSQWNSAVKMGVVIYYDSGTQKKLQTNGRYFSNSPTHQPQQFQTGLTEHGQCDGVNKWRGRGGIGGRTLVHCTIVIRPSHDADLRLGDVAYHLVDCV